MEKNNISTYIYNAVIILCIVGGGAYAVSQFMYFGGGEVTDNARVCQNIVPQNCRVQGFIREVRFTDYQEVKKGDTLVVIEDAEFRLRLAQAEADLARLNLSYCYIIATCDGIVGKKDIHEGQLVNPGQTLVSIVDKNEKWVEANYQETQMPDIQVGDKVRLKADAVPGVEYTGVVERISDATGSAFSLIPIDNATGNFVKVEQRVTVRIRIDASADLKRLHGGYNVVCKVEE